MKKKKRRRKATKAVNNLSETMRSYPDFSAIRRRIFGKKRMKITGTEIVSEGRGEY
jgi:hypothetical protein